MKTGFNFIFSLFIFVLLTGVSGLVNAKNCPSKLPANLHQVGEKDLYWGFETRLVQYFSQDIDASVDPAEKNISKAGYVAVRSIVDYTLSDDWDWLNFYFEGEMKLRNGMKNCNPWRVELSGQKELIPQLRGLSTGIDKFDMNFKIGRQNLVFGTQSVLDNYFDAIKIKKKLSKNIKLEVFGGIFAREIARETIGCGYELYYEKRKAWKRLCTARYGDYSTLGAILNFRNFKPHKLSIMNLFQYSRLDVDKDNLTAAYPENLTTNFLSIYAMGPVLGSESLSYETEFTGAFKIHNQEIIPAIVAGLKYRLKLGPGTLIFNPMYSGSFRDKESRAHFASIFEGFDLGARQRYGLYDGQVWSFLMRYKLKSFRFHAGYHYHTGINTLSSIDDEVEAGITWFFLGKEKYQLRAIYSAVNLFAGELPMSQGARFVARLIF